MAVVAMALLSVAIAIAMYSMALLCYYHSYIRSYILLQLYSIAIYVVVLLCYCHIHS